jgi:glycosyltransferase involved in cell wall biosynthesis
MLAAYDEADIFCLPSFTEGQALVLIEAMGRGVAVVATAVGGTPEIVVHERTGLLIPRDDPQALESALRRYVVDPALWRRCVEGGYQVAGACTYEVLRGRWAEVIGGLAP